MATSAYFRRTSDRQVEALRAAPQRIQKVLFPDSSETVIDEEVRLEVEAWQPLHELLAGSTNFIRGGQPFGTIDIGGEGPARGFTSAEVKVVAGALAKVTDDTLRGRFDAAKAGRWTLEALLGQLEELKEFVTITADADAGLIVYMR
jgi:hypothetical protein